MTSSLILHTVVKNRSKYPIDFVWENAKDLEHVAVLHSKTNADFGLLYVGPQKNNEHEYDVMNYRSSRKLFCFRFQACGFRRIVRKHQLHQIEYIPLLRLTVILNSVVRESNDPDFPTDMIDEVIIRGPKIFLPLREWMKKSLRRHTAIQCQEDEPFRERRKLLKDKNINLPFRIFSQSVLDEASKKFNEQPA
jgi:hypothetical protein